ncbi:uncharacterized protein METZ01_LOCUS118236 [marine metagenome]|uniref:Uncharacterized protein n=1 Tax=marine metagenome TaxID=408172 RepID=A0A381XLM5_9ZZZZ
MGLAVFSFGFLSIGSFLFGATVTTSVLRGLGGGVLFGALLWLVGLLINEEEDPTGDDIGDDVEEEGETVLSAPVVADSDAIRGKFLNKSREISEKAEEKANKEKEEKEAKEAKEATPF